MLTLIFTILLIYVFGKLLGLSIRAAWGITRILFTLVFLPVMLILLVIGGLLYIALPILVVIGIVSLLTGRKASQ